MHQIISTPEPYILILTGAGLLIVEGGDKPGQWNASDLLSVAV
ncbi:hypothetical protein [Sphingobium sp. AS12]|nr:hypothetical protein [Sphingobium sp. AS12]